MVIGGLSLFCVRVAVLKALASFSPREALPLLRERAEDEDCRVRTRATEALASFSLKNVCRCGRTALRSAANP
jgi:HEAT repeat protein